jgi:hypothetical protein
MPTATTVSTLPGQSAQSPSARGEVGLDLLHVAGLTGLAIAQPVLDLLGREPTFFVAHRTSAAELILFVSAICLGVPLLAALIEIPAAWVWPAGRRAVQALLMGGLATVASLTWLKRWPMFDGWWGLVIAGLVGAMLAWNYRRPVLRSFLTLSACLALVFPLLFFSREGVRKIWQPGSATAAEQSITNGNGKRIVLVILDELPLTSLLKADRSIDAERFPNFARLSDSSHWFENASSVHQRTPQAVPAVLTGCYPQPNKLPLAADHPHNLFSLLAGPYDRHVSEPLTMLFEEQGATQRGPEMLERSRRLASDAALVVMHLLLPSPWVAQLPPINENWADFWPAEAVQGPTWDDVAIKGRVSYDDRPQQFARFLAAMRPADRPQLNFIHILLPHSPWCYLPDGARYTNTSIPAGEVMGLRNLDEWSSTQAYQRHMSQLQYTDKLLGEMLDRLQSQQLWDDAVVVVTADHGASFWPGGSRRDADATPHPEDILSVPLWIKLPGQSEGVRHGENVETIDILPTIAQAADIPLPWKVDGHALLDPTTSPRAQKTIFNDDCVARQFPADFLDLTTSLERRNAIFGSDSSPLWLHRVGPLADQVGRDVTALVAETDSSSRFELDQPALYEQVERQGPFIPALISGRVLRGDDATEFDPLAITVNGVLWAVTYTGRQPGTRGAFTALVPAKAFFDGRNRIEVFRVRSSPSKPPELIALGSQISRAYSLRPAAEGGKETIVAPDGNSMTVVAAAVQGLVDRIVTTGGGIELSGWASDRNEELAVEQIVVFQGTRFLAAARPNMVRGSQERTRSRADAVPTGFGIFIPDRLLDPNSPPTLRTFAITKAGAATELPQNLWLGNRLSSDL